MWSYIKPILLTLLILAGVLVLPSWGRKAGKSYYDSEYPGHEYDADGHMGRGYYHKGRKGRGK